MKCPACGAAELIHDTRDLPYTYKGETTIIASVAGNFCPACADAARGPTPIGWPCMASSHAPCWERRTCGRAS